MRTWNIGAILIGLIIWGGAAHAATISGVVYDGLTLDPQSNAILTINTSPMQTKLSKDGSYTFTVENGTYNLDAEYRENGIVTLSAQRTILIDKDGSYTIDIILLPEVGDVPDEPLPSEESGPTIWDQLMGPVGWWGAIIIILAAAGYSIWNVHRTTKKTQRVHDDNREEKMDAQREAEKEKSNENGVVTNESGALDQYALEVINFLKRGGNRLTQKELRGMMKIGEAKVSLVVSELEEEKIIKKIKRGRGNILVLTEKGINYEEKKEL